MKKIIIIILIAIQVSMYGQNNNAIIDSIVITDSLQLDSLGNKNIDSESDSSLLDNIKKIQSDTTTQVNTDNFTTDNTNQKDKSSSVVKKMLPKFKVPNLSLDKDISFYTLIHIIILLGLGFLITQSIDFFSRVKNLQEKYLYIKFLITALKVSIWIVIIYSMISAVIKDTEEFIVFLIFIVLILFSISLIPLLKNIIGGFYISISTPFRRGDYISVNAHQGIVQRITLRYTSISNENANIISIPNGIFLTEPVVKLNIAKKEQIISIEYEFGFEYEAKQLIKIIYEAALSSPYTYSKLEPKVYLVKNDFVSKTRVYQLQVYIIDPKFVNKHKHSLNLIIDRAVKTLIS
ncbi:MAG: hypothetical protein CVV23_00950 [Ignavibacteriae bacterium HGW-Ignavibacteriae-2]|jgi:small conductance mechanosensitive channel|nr:MAG: hypothetical protein CVV23_00950 [Ignavibacteriae bacterium HGW-Ignavibacteriae-2]